ncbi:phosphoribosylanthranilate isomerase [candidate division KSB1 bacterium]|nr:phosphoribosylanthranilate isomerase [candidate division KSB1 bacterium]
MWLKICGITRLEDAVKAENFGADAVGFIFAKSPRQIDVTIAEKLCSNIKIPKIGVFVNEELKKIMRIRKRCNLDIIQLHGDESSEFCKALGGTIIKAIRVKNEQSIEQIQAYTNVWKILLDTYIPGQAGGTGKQIDNRFLINRDLSNIILAGGITPDNIDIILQKYAPFGLDISSGIEDSPGKKNIEKMELVIKKVKKRG